MYQELIEAISTTASASSDTKEELLEMIQKAFSKMIIRGKIMNKVYFSLTGTKYYHGKEFLKSGMEVKLEKDSENEYDSEAIKVLMKPLGQIGSVANSPYTVLGDCMSAGRLYDKIGKKAKERIVMVIEHGVICKICKKSLIN